MYYVVYAFEGKGIGSIEDAKNIVAITADNRLDITDFYERQKRKIHFYGNRRKQIPNTKALHLNH